MDLQLNGKVAVVTGASKGIGLAIVQTLVAEGVTVVAGARSPGALSELDGVDALAVDLAAPGGPERLVAHALERHGRIDVLVNNVGGVKLRTEGFLSLADADFEASLQLNFFSVNAFFHPDGLVIDYGAAKAALLNASKALSQELGPQGIRINSVSPGPVATDLWMGDDGVAATVGRATGTDADAIRSQAAQGFATRRFTAPEEVATLVVLLASPRTANVTGADYVIDGGLIKT